MKKLLFVLFALLLACGFAAAQEEEGVGLSAGIELGFGDVADKAVFGITPQLIYEHSFLEDALDVSGEVDYTFSFEDGVPQEMYAEENIGYNLFLNDASTLTFSLHNENNFSTVPEVGAAEDGSIFEPSIAYSLALNAGDLGFVLGFPIGYQPETTFGVYATAGFTSPFGLGFEITANLDISPEVGYAETNLLLAYAFGHWLTAELGVDADAEFKVYTISPYLECYFGSWTVWAGVDIDNIGGEGSVTVEPYIGVKYSF
ncbi:MAG: hypothetical protein LBB48_00090 [Treponema sp.]|jgi:hypothetical protein|nr:hypothetical protein [Treponema sp.]